MPRSSNKDRRKRLMEIRRGRSHESQDREQAIYVANHKVEPMELGYPYVPLLVGSVLHEVDELSESLASQDAEWEVDELRRSMGISDKNHSYCEMTGLYWIWKASPCKGPEGLEHYRRMLANRSTGERPLTAEEIAAALEIHDCLVAKREYFKYPLLQDYAMCHYIDDMRAVWDVLERGPRKYLEAFQRVMDSNNMHPYNIIITSHKLLKRYAKWLFKVLSKVEKRIGSLDDRSAMQQRVFGFLAERLMNVWIDANGLDVAEFPIWSPDPKIMEVSRSRYVDPAAEAGYPPAEMSTRDLLGPDGLDRFALDTVDGTPGAPYDFGFYVRMYDDVWQVFEGDPVRTRQHAQDYGLREGRMTSVLDMKHEEEVESPEPEPEAEPEVDPETEPETEAQPEPETEPEVVPESEGAPESEPESE